MDTRPENTRVIPQPSGVPEKMVIFFLNHTIPYSHPDPPNTKCDAHPRRRFHCPSETCAKSMGVLLPRRAADSCRRPYHIISPFPVATKGSWHTAESVTRTRRGGLCRWGQGGVAYRLSLLSRTGPCRGLAASLSIIYLSNATAEISHGPGTSARIRKRQCFP